MKCFRCGKRFPSKEMRRISIEPESDPFDAGIGYQVCNECGEKVEDLLEDGGLNK